MARLIAICTICLPLTLLAEWNLASARQVATLGTGGSDSLQRVLVDLVGYYSHRQSDSAHYFAEQWLGLVPNGGKDAPKDLSTIINAIGIYLIDVGQWAEAIDTFLYLIDLQATQGDSLTTAHAYGNIAGAYYYQAKYDLAVQYFTQALAVFQQLGAKEDAAIVLGNIGSLHRERGDLNRAIEYEMQSLKLAEQEGFRRIYAISLGTLGRIYMDQKDYEQAERYFHQSLAIFEELEMYTDVGFLQADLGTLFLKKADYPEAIKHFNSSLPYFERTQHVELAFVLANLGYCYQESGDKDQAITYYQRVIAFCEEVGEQRYLSGTLTKLGRLYLDENKAEKAIATGRRAMKIAKEVGNPTFLGDAHWVLYQCAKALGQADTALFHFEAYHEMTDSVFSKESQRELLRQEYAYTYQKQAMADSLAFTQQALGLQLEIERQRSQRNTFIAAALLALLLVGIVAWNYRLKQRTNRELTQKNRLVQNALADREMLIKEIHHRVKNNLQVVSSLLSLQSRNIQDKAAQQALQEGQDRVHAMALIHRHLYQDEHLVEVHLPTYFQELVQALQDSYQVDAQRIHLSLNIAPIQLDVDTLIPLGLIVNELITNAFKYAYVEQQAGHLTLSISKEAANLIVEVADNGIGLPTEIQVDQAHSMGFKLVLAFLRKMGGKLAVERQNGTCIRLIIPHPQSTQA